MVFRQVLANGLLLPSQETRKEPPPRDHAFSIGIPDQEEIRWPGPGQSRPPLEIEPGIALAALAIEITDGFERDGLVSQFLYRGIFRIERVDLLAAARAMNRDSDKIMLGHTPAVGMIHTPGSAPRPSEIPRASPRYRAPRNRRDAHSSIRAAATNPKIHAPLCVSLRSGRSGAEADPSRSTNVARGATSTTGPGIVSRPV